jgi:2-(1,2-epoxy-1,2-dihydrophenyl)acetyl-CoA isomerase
MLYERERGVAIVTLNRPQTLNAFNEELHAELHDALRNAAGDVEVRAVLLRGEGRGFSSGADIAGMVGGDGGEDLADYGEYLRRTYGRLISCLVTIKKPIVAALRGPVYGAGVGLALACDLRVAAESARFSLAFVKIGLVPDAGVSFLLPRVVGLGRAMEMSILGDALDAKDALRAGLVNRVVPDGVLEDQARALATRLARMPTHALGCIKKNLYASFENDLPTMLEKEAQAQASCSCTEDHREGLMAFREKREPNFVGR